MQANGEQEIPLDSIPDRPKRRYTKRAAKWGNGAAKPARKRKARKGARFAGVKAALPATGAPVVKLAFDIDGKRMELDLATARALYAVLHQAFGSA